MDENVRERVAGKLRHLLSRLGLSPVSLELYLRALTHASYANEDPTSPRDNERLEFLGDAVIELIVSQWVFRRFPEAEEGDLTRLRAALVCEETLARCARRARLAPHVLLGHGEEEGGGRCRPALLADVFEAFVGAIYLDTGLEVTEEFVIEQLEQDLVRLSNKPELTDAKGQLQAWYQRGELTELRYRLVSETGPDHNKSYTVEVVIDGEVRGVGVSGSKKDAEKAAAGQAITSLLAAGIVRNGGQA